MYADKHLMINKLFVSVALVINSLTFCLQEAKNNIKIKNLQNQQTVDNYFIANSGIWKLIVLAIFHQFAIYQLLQIMRCEHQFRRSHNKRSSEELARHFAELIIFGTRECLPKG